MLTCLLQDEVGFYDLWKTTDDFGDIKSRILAEKDMAAQGELRRTLGSLADVFISSASAITKNGEIVSVAKRLELPCLQDGVVGGR